MTEERDRMDYDVVIVGAGPAGLAAAIRLKQEAQRTGQEISVCVLEKGAQVGAHILSGAILDVRALNELLPDWEAQGLPHFGAVAEEKMLLLRPKSAWRIPSASLPALMHTPHALIVSLGRVCQWLAEQAEALGVDIFPGFAAVAPLLDEQGRLQGVITGDMGRHRDGSTKPEFAPGMALYAHYTLLAEGARGSLTQQLEAHFQLRGQAENRADPQHFGLGFKEVWRVKPEHNPAGVITHTLGWPLNADSAGGGFIYPQGPDQVAIGLVVHLNYRNPLLSPFEEFQRFKQHPDIARRLEGGERLAYGARAVTAGGWSSLPQLAFPGGALIGCSAGMVNVARSKGIHNAMKSGMLAAEAIAAARLAGRAHDVLEAYPTAFARSWAGQDLYAVRNVKPWISRLGLWAGMAAAGAEMWLQQLGLKLPWTLGQPQPDHAGLHPAASSRNPNYSKADGRLSFDRTSSIALANLQHDHDQPVHLQLREPQRMLDLNLKQFDAPEQRYCPAGVYEIVTEQGQPRLQINAQNCIHCKSCDIKDPSQNIVWVPPEGGSGPNYVGM